MNNSYPKRKKSRDNPYTLIMKNEKPYLSFVDGQGVNQTVELTPELYEAFSKFELEDISQINKEKRHIDEINIDDVDWNTEIAVDDAETIVLRNLAGVFLLEALNQLSNTQRRRFVLRYYYDFTYQAIANVEGCTIMPVIRSINTAEEKIYIFLKKRGYF